MEKSREAFRTISEVAEWLDVPTHVLRFWESRFSQIKPVKRAGGRRYYRPSDMRVIGGVKTLLHDQGMTIRGVQKLFREQGIKHVSSYSPVLHGSDDLDDEQVIEHQAEGVAASGPAPAPAARSTREATPVPVVDAAPSDEDASEAPVFSHARRPAPAETAPETPPTAKKVAEPEPEPEPEPEAPPAPTIPATPDVPDVDAADDDPSHPGNPGMPALLVTARRTQFRGHGDTLSKAVKRLKDLRARLN
jgi:DNA-binding transcriptional MerR regulator